MRLCRLYILELFIYSAKAIAFWLVELVAANLRSQQVRQADWKVMICVLHAARSKTQERTTVTTELASPEPNQRINALHSNKLTCTQLRR